MMKKHTPGPWHVSLVDECTVKDRDGCHVLTVLGDYNVEAAQLAADARLIAAAPEMVPLLQILAELPIRDTAPDDLRLWGYDGKYITVGNVRAARLVLEKAGCR